MGRARLAPLTSSSSHSASREGRGGTDPHMRSLRPRSGSYTQRSLPPTQMPRVRDGMASLFAAAVAAALVTMSLVVLVWVKMTQVQAGYAIHKHQQDLIELKRARSALEVEVSSLKRPERLARIGRTHFELRAPTAGQVVKLDDLASLASVSEDATR